MADEFLGRAALELDVRDVMTPGVVSVDDDATLEQAVDAMAEHRIHAVLVVGAHGHTPLGWVNTRGLLGQVGTRLETRVTDAITEEATGIDPGANVRAAIYALALPGVTRLVVRRRGSLELEGVVTDYDLTVKAAQLGRAAHGVGSGA